MYYGDFYEIPESRYLRYSSEGISGSRKYRVPAWADIEEGYYLTLGLPGLGAPWSAYLPFVTCNNISCQEFGNGLAEVTCEFSSDGTFSTDFIHTELDVDLSDVGFGPGWKWQTSNIPIDYNENYAIPAGRYIISMKVNGFDKSRVLPVMNCVNAAAWHGFPAETLLFTGARTSTKYDTLGRPTSTETAYTFEFKRFSHNLRYRKPVQVKDKNGNGYYYHTDQNATGAWAAYYVQASDPRAYTPVYASAGGWEKPIISAVNPATGQTGIIYLHTPVNFTAALDIPDQVTPTPPEPDPDPEPTPEPEPEGE